MFHIFLSNWYANIEENFTFEYKIHFLIRLRKIWCECGRCLNKLCCVIINFNIFLSWKSCSSSHPIYRILKVSKDQFNFHWKMGEKFSVITNERGWKEFLLSLIDFSIFQLSFSWNIQKIIWGFLTPRGLKIDEA